MQDLIRHRLFQMIVLVGPLTTLVVSPWISFDPISLPKLLVLTTLSFFGMGLLITHRAEILKTIDRKVRIAVGFFILAMFMSLFFSGAPIQQQIFGVFGRNTGLLAYISLMFVLLASHAIPNDYHKRVLTSLVVTSSFMTLYCLVQISGNDPIKWSQFDTFGTLGNINFLSAFLGLSTLVLVALVFDSSISKLFRIFFVFKSIVDTLIILSTGSIQGFMMIVAGLGVLGFVLIFSMKFKFKKLALWTYSSMGFVGILITAFGLNNRGPLASFIFQPSVIFRGDYWHAGWALTKKFPIFGAGLDSYGDWYREVRGDISTNRTNPDRIANTAHNIFLDISSSGGILLLIPYLFLTGLVFVRSYKYMRSCQKLDPVFSALFISWFAYQIQALVSINQIGVGVWGYIFAGCLLSYNYQSTPRSSSRKIGTKYKGKLIGAKESLIATFALILGFSLAVIPVSADVQFRKARNVNSAQNLLQNTESVGASLFHRELVLDSLMQSGEAGQQPALQLATRIVDRNPRSFFAWVVIYNLPNSGDELRSKALQTIHQLDPFNRNFK